MIFGKTKLELKVGIFVFGALCVLASFVLFIGRFKTWTSGYTANFEFNFVNGVKVGAPVRFSGVDVGEVKSLNFVFDPAQQKNKVQVGCWLKKDARIPMDSTIWVNTLGLLGEKYIEVMPGKDFNNFLGKGMTITGVEPIATHEFAQLGKNIVNHLDEIIVKINNKEGTIGKLFFDDALYNEMEATMGELKSFVEEIKRHPWRLLRVEKDPPAHKK